MTLESVDSNENRQFPLFAEPPAPQTRSGKGIPFGMMLREARQLMKGKGLKRAGMRIFLILLTVLTLLTAADYIAVSHIDPQDFITTDSHILIVNLDSGGNLPEGAPPSGYTWETYHQQQYLEHLKGCGLDFDFIPLYSVHPQYSMKLLYQQDDVVLKMPHFSYVSLNRLDPADIYMGRMPENSEEIVVDRIVPEAMLKAYGEEIRPFIRETGPKFYLDLKAINALSLSRAGVKHIEISDHCTMCRPDLYWSHRITGNVRGSQGAIILCKEETK
jgi:hypothetical protein